MYTKYYLVKKSDESLQLTCMDPTRLLNYEYLEFIGLMGEELAYMTYQYLKADRDISLQEFIWQELKNEIVRRK